MCLSTVQSTVNNYTSNQAKKTTKYGGGQSHFRLCLVALVALLVLWDSLSEWNKFVQRCKCLNFHFLATLMPHLLTKWALRFVLERWFFIHLSAECSWIRSCTEQGQWMSKGKKRGWSTFDLQPLMGQAEQRFWHYCVFIRVKMDARQAHILSA